MLDFGYRLRLDVRSPQKLTLGDICQEADGIAH